MPAFRWCAAGCRTSLGVVNAREWLTQAVRGEDARLGDHLLRQPLYVPETLTGMELLENFRSSDVQIAFVVDEYGEVQGIVTLQDLIEAIIGEFRPRDPQTSWAVQREDGSWLLDGHIPVPELKDRLRLEDRAGGGAWPLSHAQRHDHVADRAAAEGRRHRHLGRLAPRDRRHGRQDDRQGAGDARLRSAAEASEATAEA